MLMPETALLLIACAVLIALAVTFWAARRRAVRSVATRSLATRSGATRATDGGEPPAAAAGARSELEAAYAEVARLTEQLQQAEQLHRDEQLRQAEQFRQAEQLRQAELARQSEAARPPDAYADGRHVEIFVNLSRRLQSLVHREIQLLDGLENEVEDPDLLKGLFQVDHLATRIRRHAENLAVLGGSVSRRQWSRPVALTEVLRSAVAEVEHYSRVKLVPPIEGTLPGHAVASVIHLIAELIENATMFAPPHTQVLLRVQPVTAGMAIEVEDRGLGMQRADLDRVNRLLADSGSTDLDELLRDGRIGLYVVSVIARQHGVVVQLQPNIFGGIQAVVVLPAALLGPSSEAEVEPPRPQSLIVSEERHGSQERRPLQQRVPLQYRFTATDPPLTAAEDTTEIVARPLRPVDAMTLTAPAVSRPRPATAPQQKTRPTPAHAAPRQIAAAVSEEEVTTTPSRPPLPRRRSQTHMAPQLKIGPPAVETSSPPEHDPGLMASFMNGVSQGEASTPAAPSSGRPG
jgi:hypothetical protein